MSSDFCFITHTTQRHLDKFSVNGSCDRTGKRCLTDSWRTDKAQNRCIERTCHLLDRKIFHDTILDFFQTIVIFIQNCTDSTQIRIVFCLLPPWYIDQPVDICALNTCFPTAWRKHFKAAQFFKCLLFYVFRIWVVFQLFSDLSSIIVHAGNISKLFLDRSELFTQIVFFLTFVDLLLDLFIDHRFQLVHSFLFFQLGNNDIHSFIDISSFQQLLLCILICNKILGKLICQSNGTDTLGELMDNISREGCCECGYLLKLRNDTLNKHYFLIRI